MFNKEGKGNGSVSLIKTSLTTRGCLIHPTLESTTTNAVSNASLVANYNSMHGGAEAKFICVYGGAKW